MTAAAASAETGPIGVLALDAGGQDFGIPIDQIVELRRWTPATPLPRSNPAVTGVINLRGTVIPVVDLAARLDLAASDPDIRHVIVVVAVETLVAGLLVSSVSEILEIAREAISDPPEIAGPRHVLPITGLFQNEERLLRLLDVPAVLQGACEVAA